MSLILKVFLTEEDDAGDDESSGQEQGTVRYVRKG